MAVPSLDTEHPGIRVIAEVASVLQAGLASGEAPDGVGSALRRGLNLRRCRPSPRTPDRTRFAPATTPADQAAPPGYGPPGAPCIRHRPPGEGRAPGAPAPGTASARPGRRACPARTPWVARFSRCWTASRAIS